MLAVVNATLPHFSLTYLNFITISDVLYLPPMSSVFLLCVINVNDVMN